MSDSARRWAIITPTYHLDYEQFNLMCESMDHFVEGNWHHYVVVNKSDYQMFSHFSGARRTVIENTKVLPKWLHYIGKLGRIRGGNFFFSWRTGPFFGWHIQQLVKLSMAYFVEEDAMLVVDSDIFFMRRFKLDKMIENGRLPFVRMGIDHNLRNTSQFSFIDHSKKTLGVPTTVPSFDYVNNVVVWDRKTTVEVCDFIGKRHGKHWIAALSGLKTISEGMLYGLYVDHILEDKNRFAFQTYNLTKTVHGDEAIYDEELEKFVSEYDDDVIAFGFQSSARFDNKILRAIYEKLAAMPDQTGHRFG